jgi:high-affinity nickel permease
MGLEAALTGLVVLSFLLGLRHGIDWDHIAAITDLIGGEHDRKRGFVLAFWYAIGHEVVIVILGGIAVLFGMTLPEWVDNVMERIVGITLILLAAFLITALYRSGQEFIMVSRYRILFTGFYNLYAWIIGRFFEKYRSFKSDVQKNVSRSGAFAIGIAHGIGAETPTQLMMFATASGVGSSEHGVYTVLAFVIGLLLSHTFLALISLFGFTKLIKNRIVFQSLAIFTSAYSMGVGILFVIGKASILPAIL